MSGTVVCAICFAIGMVVGFVYGCATAWHKSEEQLDEIETVVADMVARVEEHIL